MGTFLSTIMNNISQLYGNQQVRIIMLGFDCTGKTTILYKLKLGKVITTIPTIGFNVETVEYRNISFTVWDVTGQPKIVPLWKHYFKNIQATIFVVDSTDRDRIDHAGQELHKLLEQDELQDVQLLILANKKDLPDAMPVAEITARFQLNKIKDRNWHIQSTCAPTGEGIYDGLDWLSEELQSNK